MPATQTRYTREQAQQEVLRILREHSGLENLDLDTDLDDELKSLEKTAALFDIEDHFDLPIPDSDIEKLRRNLTPRTIITYVNSRIFPDENKPYV